MNWQESKNCLGQRLNTDRIKEALQPVFALRTFLEPELDHWFQASQGLGKRRYLICLMRDHLLKLPPQSYFLYIRIKWKSVPPLRVLVRKTTYL